jgi:diguanylate cyclase
MQTLLNRKVPAWVPFLILLCAIAVWLATATGSKPSLDGSAVTWLAIAACVLLAPCIALLVLSRLTATQRSGAADGAISEGKKNHALVELEVARVLNLVRSRQAREQAYGASLAKVQKELASKLSPEALSLLVEHLVKENARVVQDVERSEKELHRARETISSLRESLEQANEVALRDSLTDICNRRGFDLYLEQCIKAALAHKEDLSLIMCDIDHFKLINDKHGHQTGDEVLRLFAFELAASVRGSDIACRYGGEEFAVILPRTKAVDASVVAERVRGHCEKKQLVIKQTGEPIGFITASFGVTQLRTGETSAHLIKRLDRALYDAKENGRNRVSLL